MTKSDIKSTFLKDESGKDIVEILTLETDAHAKVHVIKILHKIGPEELAMVQALYSRSYAPIINHLTEVVEKGGEKFMKQFYSGYGHKSVGDLASVLIAVEGVTMLAVKAIQDSQLYSGQEASTRYIDFSSQPFITLDDDGKWTMDIPAANSETGKIQQSLREFYLELLSATQKHLFETIPYESLDPTQCTIKARSFDIARGFLPAGASTSAAWYSSISHASDHLGWLRNHPLVEVKNIANAIEILLSKAYPASFEGRNVYPEREDYKSKYMALDYYLKNSEGYPRIKFLIDEELLTNYKLQVYRRPEKQDMPMQIGEAGVVIYDDLLDFGSFRDIQRHRAVVQRMGLLTFQYGFHDWYLDSLPYDLQTGVRNFIAAHKIRIKALGLSEIEEQYLIPMGYQVPIRLTGSLAKMFYLVELRSQKTVHPTLHANAYHLAMTMKEYLQKTFNDANEIPVYVDDEVGVFSLESSKAVKHRGEQTILKDGKEL